MNSRTHFLFPYSDHLGTRRSAESRLEYVSRQKKLSASSTNTTAKQQAGRKSFDRGSPNSSFSQQLQPQQQSQQQSFRGGGGSGGANSLGGGGGGGGGGAGVRARPVGKTSNASFFLRIAEPIAAAIAAGSIVLQQ